MAKLARFEERLSHHRLARKSSALGWMFGRSERQEGRSRPLHPGDVGRGKTWLMTCSLPRSRSAQAPRPFPRVHGRCARTHPRIRQKLKSGEVSGKTRCGSRPSPLRRRARLICFDEFHVHQHRGCHDPRPAVHAPVRAGPWLWWRPRSAPGELYKDGSTALCSFLYRVCLRSSRGDAARRAHRLPPGEAHTLADSVRAGGRGGTGRARHGLGAPHRHVLGEPCDIPVKGRVIRVRRPRWGLRASPSTSSAAAAGAKRLPADCHEFHTILLDRIPVMDFPQRNEASASSR